MADGAILIPDIDNYEFTLDRLTFETDTTSAIVATETIGSASFTAEEARKVMTMEFSEVPTFDEGEYIRLTI